MTASMLRAKGNGGTVRRKRRQDEGGKRKTPQQLQTLEKIYSGNKHPTQKEMDECAAFLGLTYDQVRLWFKDKRRKDERPSGSTNRTAPEVGGAINDAAHNRGSCLKMVNENSSSYHDRDLFIVQATDGSKAKNTKHQLLPPEYILQRVFRKDGPPIGIEFDPLPARPFGYSRFHQLDEVSNAISRKRKDPESSLTATGYGMGKGLMAMWRVRNPHIRRISGLANLVEKAIAKTNTTSNPNYKKSSSSQVFRQAKSQRHQYQKRKTISKKLQEKQKIYKMKKGVAYPKVGNQEAYFSTCKLAADDLGFQELDTTAVLLDDEELELSELQAGPNPLNCSAHLTSSGRNGCPFCKDMLSRFPPEFVKMKHPFCTRPWNSAPNVVKKLFKVFQFLYTHAVRINACSFTLDEFAQAFHTKDSLLLGRLHEALLRLLLCNVEREKSGLLRASKNCRYLGFIDAVKHRNLDVGFWVQSLNSLTWVEILRQVLIAAGFGPKHFSLRRGSTNKEATLMEKHGLRPRTLKGELFTLLSDCGSKGLKVSELSRSSQIVSLSLPNTSDELEDLIHSTLSTDITLFERIGPSAFRLRIGRTPQNELSCSESESDNSGSIDDDYGCFTSWSGSDDDESCERLNTAIYAQSITQCSSIRRNKCKSLTRHTEIDESHSGEAWLLGLMEGEYSDLSIEEKLDALVALVDLTDSVLVSQMEELTSISSASTSNARDYGSGAKIKKLLPSKGYAPNFCLGHGTDVEAMDNSRMKAPDCLYESDVNVHPPQSIHLGYDRRYNSYWLFLGPCNSQDPGHRRIYFESSEDGHWEMIDTEQGLSSLLSALDRRGTREAHLLASLEKRKTFLFDAMNQCTHEIPENSLSRASDSCDTDVISGDGSSPASDVDNNIIFEEATYSCMPSAATFHLGKRCREKKLKWEESLAFDKWIWHSFYGSLNAVKHSRSFTESLTHCEICHDLYWRGEKHCRKCHSTFELDFDLEERYAVHVATCRNCRNHRVLSSQLQTLKAAIHAIEISIPDKALVDAWTKSSHKLWEKRLRRTSSLAELFQVVADFVGAIKEEWLYECCSTSSSNTIGDDIMVFFHSMPQTSSAVALWIVQLDIQIAQHLGRANMTRHVDKILN